MSKNIRCNRKMTLVFGPLNREFKLRREVFGADCDHDGIAECIFHLGRVARVAGDEDMAQVLSSVPVQNRKKTSAG